MLLECKVRKPPTLHCTNDAEDATLRASVFPRGAQHCHHWRILHNGRGWISLHLLRNVFAFARDQQVFGGLLAEKMAAG